MRIAVTGTRGFPGVQGGVETHCMEVYPRLAALGCDISVYCRRPFTGPHAPASHGGVILRHLPSPTSKHTEAIVHTLLSVIHARRNGAQLIHIHACGPALMVPLARLLGMKTVVTLHGEDYRRAKWGFAARLALRLGEWCAGRMSHALIVLSDTAARQIKPRFPKANIFVIPNGIPSPPAATPPPPRERMILAVGRLTPEKGFHHLIEAWQKWPLPDYKLVIAGGADRKDAYSAELMHRAAASGIIMPGTISHAELAGLYSRAALFVMPSLLEGLPIALLEAMSFGVDVAVSDIPSCHLPQLSPDDYFPPGSPHAIAMAIRNKIETGSRERVYDLSAYDWNRIAARTKEVYDYIAENR